MRMKEGTMSALSQIETVPAGLHSFAAGRAAETQLTGDRQTRISRVIRGLNDQVWRATRSRSCCGSGSWVRTAGSCRVCEVGTAVGDTYHYEWEQDGEV